MPSRCRCARPTSCRAQEALAAYTARPPRVNEVFTVTIPHPGVWVTAQPHDPMQQREADERNAAG